MTTAAAWAGFTLSLLTAVYLIGAWFYVRRASAGPVEERSDLRTFLTPPPGGPDYTDLPPTEECLCGCNLFHAAVSFSEGEVAYYILEGICMACGAKVALPYVGANEGIDNE